jgi:hypothetical protein
LRVAMCGIQLNSFGFESIYRNRARTGLLENEPLECRVPNIYQTHYVLRLLGKKALKSMLSNSEVFAKGLTSQKKGPYL